MTKKLLVEMTTGDLLATIKACGEDKLANEIRRQSKDFPLETQGKVIEDKLITVKSLIHYWHQAESRVQLYDKNDYFSIYLQGEKTLLCHKAVNGNHTFFVTEESIQEIVANFYGYFGVEKEDSMELTIEIPGNLFDYIHEANKDEIMKMSVDEEIDGRIREFLQSFLENKQTMNKIEMEKKNSGLWKKTDDMLFLLGKDRIWHAEYDVKKRASIYIHTNSVYQYFNIVEKIILDFSINSYQEPVKEMLDNQKKFSIKRGFFYYLKGNIFLFLVLLIFLINRNSWSYDGKDYYSSLFLLSELMLIILSVIACLKPRVYKD